MAPLTNPKREAFCQLTLQGARYGWTQADIYKRAGYRADGHSAEVAASRLLSSVEVQRRIAELSAPAIKKMQITVQTLLTELEETISGARQAKQFGAVNGSLTLMGKLTGLLRDQIEVGAPGSFTACETTEQVIDKLLGDFGDVAGDPRDVLAALDEFRAMLVERVADRAQNITPEPNRLRLANETGLATAALRKAPGGRR